MDVYGYISVTNFKYVIFRIEARMNPIISGQTN